MYSYKTLRIYTTYKLKCTPVINTCTSNLYNYKAGINRNTLDICLGLKKLGFFQVTRPCLVLYPTPHLLTFSRIFRGFLGISLFVHIVSLSSPYKNFETKQNKILPTVPILEFHVTWNTYIFFGLTYPEPCPYINSNSSCTVIHPVFIKNILGINTHSIHSTTHPAYTVHINTWEMQRLNKGEQRSPQFSAEPL